MTMLFIILVFSVTFLLLYFNRKKLGLILFSLSLIILFAIGSGAVPSILLSYLQEPYPILSKPQWKKKNALVILGAGTTKIPNQNFVIPSLISLSRIHEGVRLYFSCKASKNQCFIILSGGDPLKNGVSEAMVYKDALLNLGLNSSEIILEQNSMNTYKNAEYTSHILKEGSFDSATLVTSGFHIKRSLLYFSNFGINPTPAPAEHVSPPQTFFPIAYNFAINDFLVHEYLGIVQFYIYNFLGWNSKK